MKLSEKEKHILEYIRRYPEWVSIVTTLCDMRSAITYDADKVQTSPNGDTVIDLVVQIEAAQERIDKVERCLTYVFKTDDYISRARKAFCYGIKRELTRYEYYSRRRMFAVCLLEVFGNEKR